MSLCTFPELELYNGCVELMPALLPGSPVQSILTNIFGPIDIENILTVLTKTTVPLKDISIMTDTWVLGFFECLSRYAPGILDIEFQGDDEDADDIQVS
jgi:hypothetical protein